MDRHAARYPWEADVRESWWASHQVRLARRLVAIFVGLILTIVASLTYMQVLFGAGLAPAPVVVPAYLTGVVVALCAKSILPSRLILMVSVGAIAAIVVKAAMDGDSRILFWVLLLPSAGGLAASVPLARVWTDSK